MRRLLITGGTGFIGSHTCLLLLSKGYELIVVDSLINSSLESLKRIRNLVQKDSFNEIKIPFFKGDIGDYKFMNDIFKKYKDQNKPIEGVIHFAGFKSISESFENPFKYYENNVNKSINLFKIMDIYECRTLVFSSSATIYANSENRFFSENSKIAPSSPYGHTKYILEEILNKIFKSNYEKWRIINLRYFNPIGAHPSGDIGENPLQKPTNLFPLINQVAIGRLKKLNIYGTNWPTKDGTAIRDYIHVMDIAEGHLEAVKNLFNNQSQILSLNLGRGIGTSVFELLEIFQDVNKCLIPYEIKQKRIGDVAFAVANNEKAISLLNWFPKRTLEQCCIDGWNWQKNNPLGYEVN